MEHSKLKKLVEVFIFLRPEGVTFEEIVEITGAEEKEITRVIEELKEKFSEGVVLDERDEKLYLTVDKDIAKELGLLAVFPLKKAELKTLGAIIVYPGIKRSELAKIRGKKAYDHVKKLKALGLIVEKREGAQVLVYPSKWVKEVLRYANIRIET